MTQVTSYKRCELSEWVPHSVPVCTSTYVNLYIPAKRSKRSLDCRTPKTGRFAHFAPYAEEHMWKINMNNCVLYEQNVLGHVAVAVRHSDVLSYIYIIRRALVTSYGNSSKKELSVCVWVCILDITKKQMKTLTLIRWSLCIFSVVKGSGGKLSVHLNGCRISFYSNTVHVYDSVNFIFCGVATPCWGTFGVSRQQWRRYVTNTSNCVTLQY